QALLDAGQPFLGVKQGVVINDVHTAGSRLFLLVYLQPSAIRRRMQALKPKIKTAPTSGAVVHVSESGGGRAVAPDKAPQQRN
ncbi:hypothetical protein MOW46_003072, partial [Serratia marcescens]